MGPSTNQPKEPIMSIRSETRTTHTITIDMPDDILAKIEMGDEVEVRFETRVRSTGMIRTPRPIRLSYSWVNYLMGWN
jgi:hypothetical protein